MKKSDAVAHYGTAAELARALGISRQAVHFWRDDVPELYQYKLQYLTNGALRVTEAPPAKGGQ